MQRRQAGDTARVRQVELRLCLMARWTALRATMFLWYNLANLEAPDHVR